MDKIRANNISKLKFRLYSKQYMIVHVILCLGLKRSSSYEFVFRGSRLKVDKSLDN